MSMLSAPGFPPWMGGAPTLGGDGFTDAMRTAYAMSRRVGERVGLVGWGVAHLVGPDGRTKQLIPFTNLITTAGDQYYAKKGIVGISPANPSAPTAANGMKLGTSSTAAAKSGAGAAIVTYIAASNVVFDATYPQAAAVAGVDTGWYATYKTTWGPGIATNATINEVALVNDQANNADGSSAANTYARALISTVNKTGPDTLAITWNHKFLAT
jgi:hypothetical protein